MRTEFFGLVPKRYLCPFCGEWHEWTENRSLLYYSSEYHAIELTCRNLQIIGCGGYNKYKFHFSSDYLYYSAPDLCNRARMKLNGKVAISSIVESSDKPIITFEVPFYSLDIVGKNICSRCDFVKYCNCVKLGDEGDGHNMIITLGFEFEQEDFDKVSTVGKIARKESELQNREDELSSKEKALKVQEGDLQQREKALEQKTQKLQNRENDLKHQAQALQEQQQEFKNQQANKEAKTMENKFLAQIYEHSPKENMEIIKQWAEKYKPTLQWAVPVASIYVAYQILNSNDSSLTVDNVDKVCEKKLGFSMETLKDQKSLIKLMTVGGMAAMAYGACKVVMPMFENKKPEEVSVEQVEEGMQKLEGVHQKFGWLQPMTEKLLPVALTVIMVYAMTTKENPLGRLGEKASKLKTRITVRGQVYLEMFKLFVADKLHIDLDNEEEAQKAKKFAFMAAVVGLGVLLYGKKMLDKREASEKPENNKPENEGMKIFMDQVMNIMKELMPVAFAGATTWLVAKHVMKAEEDQAPAETGADEQSSGKAKVVDSVLVEEKNPAPAEEAVQNPKTAEEVAQEPKNPEESSK